MLGALHCPSRAIVPLGRRPTSVPPVPQQQYCHNANTRLPSRAAGQPDVTLCSQDSGQGFFEESGEALRMQRFRQAYNETADPEFFRFRSVLARQFLDPASHPAGTIKVKPAGTEHLVQGDVSAVGMNDFRRWIQCLDHADHLVELRRRHPVHLVYDNYVRKFHLLG
ncbi:hypothetical protein SAMN05216417_12138 [Nitrosospira multiformis]|uniref:Uncharacterized protein n=1 Tax=Nitrosospira multiformis TaxID=1231 RepID=A0A1I7ILR6_9PROT|nr:hypothetical protein SAMN05216417_12138 [Nitrosospira multiformis]